jgi:DNA repair protein RadC
MTAAAQQALALFGVRLLDHIIIADSQYYSFRDNGDL